MQNISKRQQWLILPKNCLRTQLWFHQNIWRSIQKVPMTTPSRGSLWYLRCCMHLDDIFFYRKPMGSWENPIMLISLSVVQCIAMVPLSFRILCVFQLIFSLASVKIYHHVIKARKRVNLQRETRRAWVSQLWRSWWWRWVVGRPKCRRRWWEPGLEKTGGGWLLPPKWI